MSVNTANVPGVEEEEMLILRARAEQLAASPGVQRLLANPQLLMQMAESDPELLKVILICFRWLLHMKLYLHCWWPLMC